MRALTRLVYFLLPFFGTLANASAIASFVEMEKSLSYCVRELAAGAYDLVDIYSVQTVNDTSEFLRAGTAEDLSLYGSVSQLRPLGNKSGRPLHRARYRGHDVVVKFMDTDYSIHRSSDRHIPLVTEGLFLKLMSDLNIGPHFYGIARVDGRDALISEFIPHNVFVKTETWEFENKQLLPRSLKAKVEGQLNRIIDLMHEREIYMSDWQFIVTTDGRVYVIDPEAFELYSTMNLANHRDPYVWMHEKMDAALAELFPN